MKQSVARSANSIYLWIYSIVAVMVGQPHIANGVYRSIAGSIT
jgi:hypothetical protein